MKKRTVLCALLSLGVLLAGCGKEKQVLDPNDPAAIVVWHYYSGMQKNMFDQLVQEFNETVGAEKGIVVTVESKGEVNALAQAVLDAAEEKVGAEEMPDVFATYMDTANMVYEMGKLTDISQYMTKEEMDAYVDSFLEEGRLKEGELQVFPVAKSTELLYLNKTDWDKFAKETGHTTGELDTWESIAGIAEEYFTWSGGKAFFGRDAVANYVYIGAHQLGSDLYQKQNGTMTVQLDETAEKALTRIWDCYAVPYIKGYYGAYGRFRSDDVKTGDLLACVGATSSVAYFPQEVTREDGTTYPIEAIVLPLPNFEGTAPSAVQQGAGMAVTKSDAKQETAAVTFLKWFTDEKQSAKFCVDSGYFPVKESGQMEKDLEKVMKEKGITEEDLVYQNAMMGMKMLQETELYVPPVIENGEDYRKAVTKSMTASLDQWKEEYAALSEGEKEKALEGYREMWLTELRRELKR